MSLRESLQVVIIISFAAAIFATTSEAAVPGSISPDLSESVHEGSSEDISMAPYEGLSDSAYGVLPEGPSKDESMSESECPRPLQIDSLLNYTLEENLREIDSHEVIFENQSLKLQSLEVNASTNLTEILENARSLQQYECQLRERAMRLAVIEAQLREEWPDLDIDERVEKTRRLEDLLRRQAILLYDFQSHLKRCFCRLTIQDQDEFLTSFMDLLEREADLLEGFEDFGHRLQDAQVGYQIEYLASFEDLIRRQAVLLDIYQDLLKTDCRDLKLYKYIRRCGEFRPCQNVTYYFVLESTCNCTISGISITDDQLGEVVGGITLGPYEKMVFAKNSTLNYPTGERVCNTAHASGTNSEGLVVSASSNRVCITIDRPVLNENFDYLTLGDQRTIALAADPAIAENSVIIEKNQNKECCSKHDALNYDAIDIGDQLAGAFQNSRASNRIKVVADQE